MGAVSGQIVPELMLVFKNCLVLTSEKQGYPQIREWEAKIQIHEATCPKLRKQ